MTTARQRRFPWWVYWIVLAIILLVALAPVFSVMVAGSIAEANGCALDEGSVHPCIVNGEDIGSTLYTLGVMGWFMLATIPLGAGALLLWAVVLIVHRLYWGRKREATPSG
ncbi:hypothetical protein [Devosia sp. A16]|uniref:hypothetical protein n=1 Tax=Devosia sp. A16 TaxID=1736675 RepID=UPI0006D799BD|nr:hypothetical protein [Devosia sp. A16]